MFYWGKASFSLFWNHWKLKYKVRFRRQVTGPHLAKLTLPPPPYSPTDNGPFPAQHFLGPHCTLSETAWLAAPVELRRPEHLCSRGKAERGEEAPASGGWAATQPHWCRPGDRPVIPVQGRSVLFTGWELGSLSGNSSRRGALPLFGSLFCWLRSLQGEGLGSPRPLWGLEASNWRWRQWDLFPLLGLPAFLRDTCPRMGRNWATDPLPAPGLLALGAAKFFPSREGQSCWAAVYSCSERKWHKTGWLSPMWSQSPSPFRLPSNPTLFRKNRKFVNESCLGRGLLLIPFIRACKTRAPEAEGRIKCLLWISGLLAV
jgi:hypothetical protein